MLATGFPGGYTTFSTLALGDVSLFLNGYWLPALLYIVLSLLGGIVAVILGDMPGQSLVHTLRPKHSSQALSTLAQVLHSASEQAPGERLDMEDDLLIPDAEDERKT